MVCAACHRGAAEVGAAHIVRRASPRHGRTSADRGVDQGPVADAAIGRGRYNFHRHLGDPALLNRARRLRRRVRRCPSHLTGRSVSVNPRSRHDCGMSRRSGSRTRAKKKAVGSLAATWQLSTGGCCASDFRHVCALAHGDGRASYGGLVCTCTYDDCTLRQACIQTTVMASSCAHRIL